MPPRRTIPTATPFRLRGGIAHGDLSWPLHGKHLHRRSIARFVARPSLFGDAGEPRLFVARRRTLPRRDFRRSTLPAALVPTQRSRRARRRKNDGRRRRPRDATAPSRDRRARALSAWQSQATRRQPVRPQRVRSRPRRRAPTAPSALPAACFERASWSSSRLAADSTRCSAGNLCVYSPAGRQNPRRYVAVGRARRPVLLHRSLRSLTEPTVALRRAISNTRRERALRRGRRPDCQIVALGQRAAQGNAPVVQFRLGLTVP